MQAQPSRFLPAARRLVTSPRFWLPVLILLAWGLRLFHLGSMSLWWDETLSYDRALRDLASILGGTIQIQTVVTRDLHPPLYFLLLHFAIFAFGITEFALRLISTFANVLTVALFYPVASLLGRYAGFRRPRLLAVIASLLAALSPFYVWYSQEARPYSLVLFWSLLSFYALCKALRIERLGDRHAPALPPIDLRYGILYAVTLGATLATHYLSFVLLPFHAALLLLLRRRDRRAVALAAVLLAAFGIILLVLPRGAEQLTGTDEGGATFVPLFIILRDVLNSFSVGVTANLNDVALLDLTLLAVWLLGIAATVRVRRRASPGPALLMLTFLFVPPLALQAGSYLRPLYLNSRHLITASPPFYLGLAFGITALAERAATTRGAVRRLVPGVAALGCLLLAVGGAAYSMNNLYFNPAYAKDDHKGWAEYLRERMRPDDILILDAPQAETIYRYYGPPGLTWISLPFIGVAPQAAEQANFKAIVDAMNEHPRVWFLEIHRPVGDRTNHIFNLLARFGTWLNVTYFAGTSTQIVLHEIATADPVLSKDPSIQHPPVIFDNNLQLLGYEMPDRLAAGNHAAVKLLWRLARPTGEDYAVSIKAVDEAGALWAQWDDSPDGPLMPLSKWPAGKTVTEYHHLPLAPGTPPGPLHLELTVYHPASGEPLTPRGIGTVTGSAVVRLGDFTVTRPATPIDPGQLTFDRRASVNYGGTLELVGYDFESTTAVAGGDWPVTLFFRLNSNPGHDLDGKVIVSAPWWAIWDRTSQTTSFTLPLSGRLPGDIVQISRAVRMPADAAGERRVRLELGGLGAADLESVSVETQRAGGK